MEVGSFSAVTRLQERSDLTPCASSPYAALASDHHGGLMHDHLVMGAVENITSESAGLHRWLLLLPLVHSPFPSSGHVMSPVIVLLGSSCTTIFLCGTSMLRCIHLYEGGLK